MKKTQSTALFLGIASAMAFAQDGSACIAFKNGAGDYDKHCYNSGLRQMAAGKCYTMNKDRVKEGVPQWINEEANQTWWWSETSCGDEPVSSSSVESSSSEVPESSSSETGTTALNVSQMPHFNISVEGRTVSVQGAAHTAYLLDAQGKLIAKAQPSGNAGSIAVPRAGSYLLRIGNELRRVSVR